MRDRVWIGCGFGSLSFYYKEKNSEKPSKLEYLINVQVINVLITDLLTESEGCTGKYQTEVLLF